LYDVRHPASRTWRNLKEVHMRVTRSSVLAALSGLAVFGLLRAMPQPQSAKAWSFDQSTAGQLPAEISPEVGEWKVVADATAPTPPHVLAQLAKNARPVFNVALVRGTSYSDLHLEVKFKAIAGEIDQGGGLVWRARDTRNYYIARFNPLENNFRVYKVVAGQRTQLQTADVTLSPGWHTLRITMAGQKIECFLDGKKFLEATDDTFSGAGQIGVWTKADAQTHFDDLSVRPLAGSSPR
jgi:hypothetical protein